MSNFIDHWLNTTAIEEATRAKKLKRQGKISPEDYAQAEQTLEQKLSRYVTDDPEKMHYITFISDMATAKDMGDDDIPPPAPGETDIRRKERKSPAQTKVGINPLSRYDTPNGIYTYPLTPKMFKSLLDGMIGGHGFAQRSPFVALLKPKDYSKVLKLQARNYSDERFDSSGRIELDTNSPVLKDNVFKLLKKDSPIRRKLRETNIEDYKRARDFVQNIEKEIIANKATQIGISKRDLTSLDNEKMMAGLGELRDKLETPAGQKMFERMTQAFKEREQGEMFPSYEGPSFDKKTFIQALCMQVIEQSSRAMAHFREMELDDVEMLAQFYNSIHSNSDLLAAGRFVFVDGDGQPLSSNNAINEPEYLKNAVMFAILTGISAMFSHTAKHKATHQPDEEMGEIPAIRHSQMMKNMFMDMVDDFNEEYDLLFTAKKFHVASTEFKKVIINLFKRFGKYAAQLRAIEGELRRAGNLYAEFKQLRKFIGFLRSLCHPSRMPSTTKRVINSAFSAGFNPNLFTLNAYEDSDLLVDNKLRELYISGFSTSKSAEAQRLHKILINNRTFVAVMEWSTIYKELKDLLENSVEEEPVVDEGELTEEEMKFIRSSLSTSQAGFFKTQREANLSFYPNEENNKIFQSIVDKLYEPTAEEILATRTVKKALDDSRILSPTGILWNITRHMAGIQSQRIAVSGGKGYKRVPALWNAIWRYLGYDGVTDLVGSGTIHPAENTQAVFYNRAFIDVVEVFTNTLKSGRKEGTEKLMTIRAIEIAYKNYIAPELAYYEASQFPVKIFINRMEKAINSSRINAEYSVVLDKFKNIKNFEDASELGKNSQFADLISFYLFDLSSVTQLFDGVYDYEYKPKIPAKIQYKGIANSHDEAHKMIFRAGGRERLPEHSQALYNDFHHLLLSYFTKEEYQPNFERPDVGEISAIREHAEKFLMPAIVLSEMAAKRDLGGSEEFTYTPEELKKGILKIEGIHKIAEAHGGSMPTSNQYMSELIDSVVQKKIKQFVFTNMRQVPTIVAQDFYKYILENPMVKASFRTNAMMELKYIKLAYNKDDASQEASRQLYIDVVSNFKDMFNIFKSKAKKAVFFETGKQQFIDISPMNRTEFNSSPVVAFFENQYVSKGMKIEDVEIPDDGISELPEQLMKFYVEQRAYSIINLTLQCFRMARPPSDYGSSTPNLPGNIYEMDFFGAYKDKSQEDMPLQEVDRLIKEMEKVLNERLI